MRRRIPPTMQRKQTDPSFLHFKLYNKDLFSSHLYRKFQEKLLDHELKQKRTQQRILSRKLKSLKSDLQSTFSYFDFLHLSHLIENCNRKNINRVKLNHDRKIFNLGLRTANLEHKLDPNKVIYNFSSRHLSEDETEALSHGFKFGLPPSKVNYCKYFLPFEKLFGNLKEEPIYCNNSGDGRK